MTCHDNIHPLPHLCNLTNTNVNLREETLGGEAFGLRDYQKEAVGAFHAGGSERGGSGIVVLPCGSGKTVVGLGVLDKIKTNTLILTTNTTALRQWRDEILDKTNRIEAMKK